MIHFLNIYLKPRNLIFEIESSKNPSLVILLNKFALFICCLLD